MPLSSNRPCPSRKKLALHIARFLLLGIYTGTRAGAIAAAAFEPGEGAGWVDLVAGIWYRQPAGKRKTKKRATTVQIPKRLLAHLRRWKRINPEQRHVIEFNGKAVLEVNKGFAVVARRAGLGPEVTPHTLRHTCATWLMQTGADLWDAAGYLAMTYALLESVYGQRRRRSTRSGLLGSTRPPSSPSPTCNRRPRKGTARNGDSREQTGTERQIRVAARARNPQETLVGRPYRRLRADRS